MSATSSPFPAEEFMARREGVFRRIGNGLAVVQGAGPCRGFELFRQTNELHYLCGVELPQAYLLLDGRDHTTTLLTPPPDRHAAHEGPGAPDAAALAQAAGLDAVEDLPALIGRLKGASTLYTPHSPAEGRLACRDELLRSAHAIAVDPWDDAPSREARFTARLRAAAPGAEIRDLSPILDDLRLIKSPREVEVMRRAGKLCALAVREAMRCTRPGVIEHQLAAVADYVHRINGARSEAYRPIIAGGENIWYAHYYRNDCPLRDGDLVLMDYAPDVCNYTSDIGRMWPVNGRYSPAQRELYGFMVEYHKTLLGRLRPGVPPQQVLDEAAAEMSDRIAATRFSKPIYEQAARRTLEFKGHLSHPVGMAVHDVGRYWGRPLEPGLVFALDPQLWAPEERLYIRVEDTVVITTDGVEVLTPQAPLELDDVESWMRTPGMLERFPTCD
ncbi:MAG: aminopeptidase P N-terminal domain-containing protein [Actinomycetota bacterium]